MTTLMEANPLKFNNVNAKSLPDTYYRFFEVGLGYFMTQGISKDFASSYDFKKYQDMFGGQIDPSSIANSGSVKGATIAHMFQFSCTRFSVILASK